MHNGMPLCRNFSHQHMPHEQAILFTAGKQLAVRPVLDLERPHTHGWSLGASDGDHNIRLDAMDEGLTRLVASLPSEDTESKGECSSLCLK